MVFSSTTFMFLFLPVVLIAYYNPFFKSVSVKNAILLLSSIFFYAWGEPVYVLLMLGSVLINWIFGLVIDRNRENKKSKLALVTAVAINLGILFVFKYLTFALENINALFHTDIDTLNITLPIGISFFTFQAMSYVIDVYRGDGEVQKNPCNTALYISFFPQLIAGPIVRYQTIADQIRERHENFDDFANGAYRFMIGFVKKVLIANNVAMVADGIFDSEVGSVASAWLGAVAYTLQIFFDFSGYSEMAIGLGKMFGFTFLENFDYPYISKSVSEFWRRWHISLGTWFRDYVYFPLGGSRVKKSRLVFNLFVVWTLTGIWHGAGYNFLLWGFILFLLIATEKYLTGKFLNSHPAIGHIYMILIIPLMWAVFAVSDMRELGILFTRLFPFFGTGALSVFKYDFLKYLKEYFLFFIVSILFSTRLPYKLLERIKNSVFVPILLLVIFSASIYCMYKGFDDPFLYFRF